jgi:general secretion pathway protein I
VSGEFAGHRWRMDVLPYTADAAVPDTSRWIPQAVVLRVQGPNGALIQLDTVRLVPRRQP